MSFPMVASGNVAGDKPAVRRIAHGRFHGKIYNFESLRHQAGHLALRRGRISMMQPRRPAGERDKRGRAGIMSQLPTKSGMLCVSFSSAGQPSLP